MKGILPGLDMDLDFDKDNLVSFGKQTKNVFHLWLIDEIGEPRSFMKWFDILQSASEDDVVVVHINSPGGSLWTALQIVTQIKMCQAQVLCQIESSCCSAATMVALACDGMYCYPFAHMMIHTSSGIQIGKQSDLKKSEEFFNPWLEDFFNEIYKHFLTKKEIQSVLNGTDMWLRSEEVMERFKRRVDIINRENNKAKREHMKKLNSFMSELQNLEQQKIATNQPPEAGDVKSDEDEKADEGNSKQKPKTQKSKAKPAKKQKAGK